MVQQFIQLFIYFSENALVGKNVRLPVKLYLSYAAVHILLVPNFSGVDLVIKPDYLDGVGATYFIALAGKLLFCQFRVAYECTFPKKEFKSP